MGSMTLLDQALDYAERGWHVIPLHRVGSRGCTCLKQRDCISPGKHPRTQNGLDDATRDPDLIDRWWARWPQANIGIVTGEISGVVVLDIDADKGGFGSLDDMETEHEQLDDTDTVATGGGGHHRYFKWPGDRIGNRQSMRPGIDFRGDGGYVVAPGSNHESGRRYEWIIEQDELTELPQWLEDEVRSTEQDERPVPKFEAKDWDGTVPDEVQALVEDSNRLSRLFKRDKRFKAEGGDPSACDFSLACELYSAGVTDPQVLAHGLMASRSKDPEAWAKVSSKSQKYFEKTVTNAIARVDTQRAEQKAIERQTHAAWRGPYLWNEQGNADRFLAIHSDDLIYHVTDKRWLVWDGTHYAGDDVEGLRRGGMAGLEIRVQNYLHDLGALVKLAKSEDVREKAEKFVRSCGNVKHVRSIVGLIQPHCAVVETMLDPETTIFNCLNGVIDLETGELRPHDRAHMATQVAGAVYDPTAKSDLWESFLEEVLPDPDVRAYFQLCVGYSMLGEQPEQVFFFVHGSGGTGKSTAMKAISAAFGSYHRSADFSTFLDAGTRSGSGPSSDLARLARSRCVTSIEVGHGKKLNDGLIKQLSGGDTVTARKLHANETEWTPVMSLWLVANDRPKGRVDDDALWRRLRPFAFDQKVSSARRDSKLQDRLLQPEHRAGILAWMVKGAERYLETGDLGPPQAILDGIESYRESSNPLTEFYSDACVRSPNAKIERSRLWKTYRQWCGENEAKAMRKGTFFQLVEADHLLIKTNTAYMFEGLSLQSSVDDSGSWFERGKSGKTEGVL